MELDLAPEDVLARQSRTEGWIAGLQLAALSLQERRDVQQFLADFGGSHRHIVDYLVEEVLSQQPEEVQSFLLHTSILDRLTGPLCDALLGHHDGEAMLEHLERANLFLVPLDERRQWYRYHQLFAEVLRVRLVRAIGKQEVAALYGRASAWFELNGFLKEAVEAALAAADFGRAAHLIEQVGPALLFRFEQATLLRWLARFPQERVFAHTTLCRFYAWGLFFSGAVDAYEAPLQQAERLARADGRSLGYVYALRAYVARFHTADASAVIAWGQAALLLLPEQEREMRSVMAVMVASSYRFTGEARAAWQMATEARASSEGAGYAAAIQGAMFELAEVLVLQGKLPQATQTYQELIKAIDPLPPLTVEALLGLAGFFEGNVQVNGNFAATGTKAFVQAHPTDPSREIVYVALEGGEAGTYMRGTGQLQSGKAVLALPEHFGLVTATEGLTIQLTPRGEWLHLYLVELDTAQLVVREAQGKSRAFDYLIHGVRRGYEQHEVLRMKR